MEIFYPTIRLYPGRERSLLTGHPWIFSGAIAERNADLKAGDVATLLASNREPLGLGFYNPDSDIAIRLLTRDPSSRVDFAFWRKRIREAQQLRQRVIPPKTNAFRLINAEGDFMPGLVVDRYGEVLVVSIGTAGMEKCRSEILEILAQEIHPGAILERSEGKSRLREGLAERMGVCYGSSFPNPLEILENGLRFQVDLITGQKSGFFLDQRSNRELASLLCGNSSVLNCFSYTGAFSVYCSSGGARKVLSVDSSEPATQIARQNLSINGFSAADHPVIKGDVFQFLRDTTETFDFIILDPPAFAKSRKDVNRAARGYKDVNWTAMQHLPADGLLMTFSCSNFVDAMLFNKIVLGAARDAGKNVQILKTLDAGSDHPVLLAHTEGRYLKGLLLRLS